MPSWPPSPGCTSQSFLSHLLCPTGDQVSCALALGTVQGLGRAAEQWGLQGSVSVLRSCSSPCILRFYKRKI